MLLQTSKNKIIACTHKTGLFVSLVFIFFPFFSHALTVSPAKIEISGDPGSVVSGEFLILNEQKNSMSFYTSAEDFEARGETGTPFFMKSEDELSSWIEVDPKFALEEGQQKVVNFKINIPKDASPGGHFAAIFLSTTPPDLKNGQVSVGAKIGVLVFLRVSGDVKTGGGILDFKTTDGGRLFSSLPINFTYRFQNSGGDRVRPEGTFIVRNIFGWKVETLSANPIQGNVLPQSIRKFDLEWGKEKSPTNFFKKAWFQISNFAFGGYRAEVFVEQSNSKASFIFFVIPWQLLSIIFVFGILFGYFGFKGLKRYNAWIISEAQKHKK